MIGNPLIDLRDIHTPLEPSWWPPAPGWWLLVILTATLIACATVALYKRNKLLRPRREAERLIIELYQATLTKGASNGDYVRGTNEILKRLIVNVLGRRDLAPTSAASWLQALDEMSGTTEFTQGAGAVFGISRYSRNPPEVDLSELHKLVISLVSRIEIHKKFEPKSRITND